jgi:hypothetical protein
MDSKNSGVARRVLERERCPCKGTRNVVARFHSFLSPLVLFLPIPIPNSQMRRVLGLDQSRTRTTQYVKAALFFEIGNRGKASEKDFECNFTWKAEDRILQLTLNG